uniref:Uncharacterized protein n=1 Tax=Cyclopterus lumpus TaxID=8103 RepID=A0A8C2WJL9_CYCLU
TRRPDSSSTQPLVSPKEKEATEKRGRGRPRKQPQVKTSDVSSGNLFIEVGHCSRFFCVSATRSTTKVGVCVKSKEPGTKTSSI